MSEILVCQLHKQQSCKIQETTKYKSRNVRMMRCMHVTRYVYSFISSVLVQTAADQFSAHSGHLSSCWILQRERPSSCEWNRKISVRRQFLCHLYVKEATPLMLQILKLKQVRHRNILFWVWWTGVNFGPQQRLLWSFWVAVPITRTASQVARVEASSSISPDVVDFLTFSRGAH